MNTCIRIAVAGLTLALSSTASAQFSVGGTGSAIPTSGSGGSNTGWPLTMPSSPAIGTATVPVSVFSVESIEIVGLTHTYIGDLQATLSDPMGIEHLIFLRPGGGNATNAGSFFDFTGGNYVFVESGAAPLPTASDVASGTYDQSFDNGAGETWLSGSNNINNTPMTTISGPAGVWSLKIYDWWAGDTGSFASWTLNGNGVGGNTGLAYCFGDGTGAICPCSAFGAVGEGCTNTSGTGMTLTAAGNADTAGDSFALTVTGGPPLKPGIFFQGGNQLNNPIGDGVICSNATKRYAVNSLDSSGSATQAGFGAFATSAQTMNYQYWYRDPGNACGGGFNFSNGWVVTWL